MFSCSSCNATTNLSKEKTEENRNFGARIRFLIRFYVFDAIIPFLQ